MAQPSTGTTIPLVLQSLQDEAYQSLWTLLYEIDNDAYDIREFLGPAIEACRLRTAYARLCREIGELELLIASLKEKTPENPLLPTLSQFLETRKALGFIVKDREQSLNAKVKQLEGRFLRDEFARAQFLLGLATFALYC